MIWTFLIHFILTVILFHPMKDDVLSSLPVSVRALFREIEDFARLPIGIEKNTHPPSSIDPNPQSPATEVSHDKATIYLRTIKTDSQGILHELLHIYRYWVEKIPRLIPVSNDNNNWGITSGIENDLEHLIIVPKEADYGYEPYSHWNYIVSANWSKYPWPDMTAPFARRRNCLLSWLYCANLVTDQKVREHVKACLENEGLFAEAERFRKKIDTTIGHKPSALSTAVRFLKIPRNDVKMVYLDVQNRQRIEKKIPLF